jgi:hypothetical protein
MMEELNEEEIQRLLEQQLKEGGMQELPGSNKDAGLYQLLFAALADEPGTLQNSGLAEAVVKQIKINEQKTESLRYNILIAAVLVAGLLSSYFAISYLNPAVLQSALIFIEAYKWIFIFIIFCFGIIEIADKSLVKRSLVIKSLGH